MPPIATRSCVSKRLDAGAREALNVMVRELPKAGGQRGCGDFAFEPKLGRVKAAYRTIMKPVPKRRMHAGHKAAK